MKRIISVTLLISLTTIIYFLLTQPLEKVNTAQVNDKRGIPIPTQVYENMKDEEGFGAKKRAYFDLIHGNNPEIDWRAINEENFRNIYTMRAQMRKNKAIEIFADGLIEAEWIERGSNNLAGNVQISDYDPTTDAIYAISDGGILWKGNTTGNTWTPLNEDIRFGVRVIKAFYLPGGDLRIMAARGHSLFYSDDEGLTWTQSTGFTSSTDYGTAVDLVQLNDAQKTVVYLYTGYNFGTSSWQNRLAYSTNNGTTFTFVTNFNTSSSERVSMAAPYNSGTAYIVNGTNQTYKFEGGILTSLSGSLGLTGGSSSQIEANMTSTDTTLYVLTDNENLYKSTNGGISFTSVSTLPVLTWGVGMQVSIDNPDILYFGEMELYRSSNGGVSWTKVNEWWEYYDDVPGKIHADIMSITPFKDSNGDEFTLIPNHGGVSISYDNLVTTENIGMLDLNVGQFYDVITSPLNSNYIFGGSQDQGFQRTSQGNILSSSYFEQVISGDYGQMQFSNNGQGIWIQYPGADFSYYENAITDASSAFWHNIDGDDMPSYDWIVPTGAAPNPADDYILVGGGSVTAGSGSYLIKLENVGGSASMSQFNFDFNAESGGGNISSIETTPLNENKWYVATENGKFFHSEDAGATWTQTPSFTGPENDWIFTADIYASRLTPDLVFMAGSGYSTDAVYMSTDGGDSFSSISSALPETMVHELCMDPTEQLLYAATDAGPYVYVVANNTWHSLLGLSAPVQNYMSVEYVTAENLVRFSTWGRGIWDFKIAQVSGQNEILSEQNTPIYPNPSATGEVTINANQSAALVVFNIQGQEMLRTYLSTGKNNLQLNHLKSGTYIFVIINENGKAVKEKWVKN